MFVKEYSEVVSVRTCRTKRRVNVVAKTESEHLSATRTVLSESTKWQLRCQAGQPILIEPN